MYKYFLHIIKYRAQNWTINKNSRIKSIHQKLIIGKDVGLRGWIGSVSYTHLDVYKRQCQYRVERSNEYITFCVCTKETFTVTTVHQNKEQNHCEFVGLSLFVTFGINNGIKSIRKQQKARKLNTEIHYLFQQEFQHFKNKVIEIPKDRPF